MQPVLLLEFRMGATQIATTIRSENSARFLRLLAISKQGAEDASDALVPGQLAERLGVGYADQLRRLGAITDVLVVSIEKKIGGGTVDELESALANRFPVVGRDAPADEPAGDRDELIVDGCDAKLVDLSAHLAHHVCPSLLSNVSFEIRHFFSHRYS